MPSNISIDYSVESKTPLLVDAFFVPVSHYLPHMVESEGHTKEPSKGVLKEALGNDRSTEKTE